MADGEEEEIVLDSELPGVRITLAPVPPPPARQASPPAPGFAEDEWAGAAPGGRVVAFLREPVARCHLDRVLIVEGERRIERPLPPWIYYGFFARIGKRLLVGAPRQAFIVDWDGTMTTLLEEPDGAGVHVCWIDDDTAAAAGYRTIVVDGPAGQVTLACNAASAACVVAPGLLVVSDDDGSQWIHEGRVVARDWRTIAAAHGDVVVGAAGDAFRVTLVRDFARD
ncbi:MAG: hypothetical protein JWN44_2397 [Myxococcales bacterium]|nr:hypothetical protein [Myxococcales bacterium]